MPTLSVRLVTSALAAGLLLAACGSGASTLDDTVALSDQTTAAVEPEPTVEAAATTEPATAVAPTAEPAPEPTAAAVGTESSNDGLFPTVVAVDASTGDGTTWRFNVTLLSEYDSPERYADAWRVLDADDNELGIRVLAHDHAGEQPFTRSTNVEIADQLTTVFVEGRDQVNGWSGERFEVTLER